MVPLSLPGMQSPEDSRLALGIIPLSHGQGIELYLELYCPVPNNAKIKSGLVFFFLA